MGRPRKRYKLWQKPNGIFYYATPNSPRWKSTGKRDRREVETYVEDQLQRNVQDAERQTLKDFLEPYFEWPDGPHVSRLIAEGKIIGQGHVEQTRRCLDRHVIPDPIASMKIEEIRRSHLLDFRMRLMKKAGPGVANTVMSALRTCFREALFREDISRNPLQGIGQVNQVKQERGTFTVEELKKLFPTRELGPWKSRLDFAIFLTAASTGMRCGELLALRWKNVDFENAVIHVTEAVKAGTGEIGKPKWNRTRIVPLPLHAAKALKTLRAMSHHVLPDAFVFCYSDGTRLGHTWWSKHFRAAMRKAGILTRTRRISAHSFRHTLSTLLADCGYAAEKIQASLGWASDSTRMMYTHLKADKEQAKIIDGVFETKKASS